jgi:diaminohydroxyphosphoribosylaminopyrimidine deaminase/5-amino-6-(5-phosphoribosylamino)uracil reductase
MSMRTITSVEEPGRGDRVALVSRVEERAMDEAIRLARRGIGTTHPNPRVGAVVLAGGTVVARGYHARPGDAHAEVRALESASGLARGATLVVTLEPCAHHGRTPPCVDAILEAGVSRVVVAMTDPNPLVDGRGLARLRAEGLDVAVGLREEECRALNLPYLKGLATGLPWVLLKSMVTLDGRIAGEGGDSRGLGGREELRLAHRLRAACDAVLVGVGTVLKDDPELTVRLTRGRNPVRVVLDGALRTPVTSRLVATAGDAPLLIATVSKDARRTEALRAAGAEVRHYPADSGGRVPLRPLLRDLAGAGRLAVLVEGGPTVHTSFLREGLADRVAVGIAPIILGGLRAPAWTGDLGRALVADAIPVDRLAVRRVGRDIWLEGDLSPGGARHV